jgi:hypothetical protein
MGMTEPQRLGSEAAKRRPFRLTGLLSAADLKEDEADGEKFAFTTVKINVSSRGSQPLPNHTRAEGSGP